jgi:hypothetical protein
MSVYGGTKEVMVFRKDLVSTEFIKGSDITVKILFLKKGG